MYRILEKKQLNEAVTLMRIEAPLVARKARAGQFIMLRTHDGGERIPLTIADFDRQSGSVTIIFQLVGKTTNCLALKNEGDYLEDFVGPLGNASEFGENVSRVAVIGGGLGTAIAYPQAKQLHAEGKYVELIAGFKNKDLIILENELKAACNELLIATDDGSNGRKGFVTDVLRERIEAGANYDLVIAIGPLPMMKFVCLLTKEYGIHTVVSMNPLMVDGTGMCGCCRVTVGGETKFTCVDGPDFDGHLVDFDEAMKRSRVYAPEEAKSLHRCRLTGELREGR